MMNVCVVSTFEGSTEDYMEMFNSTKEQAQGFMADYDVGIIREGVDNMLHMVCVLLKKNMYNTPRI